MTVFPIPRLLLALVLGILLLTSSPALADRLSALGRMGDVATTAVGPPPDFGPNERRAHRLRAWAQAKGLEYSGQNGEGRMWLLYRLLDGRPAYVESQNEAAAVSIAVPPVRDAAGLGFEGSGQVAGLWDVGVPLSTHQEFDSRVTLLDDVTRRGHATHVAGTILATGIDPAATGMAPAAELRAFNAANDITELTGEVPATPAVIGGMRVSAHPYGLKAGWAANDNASGTQGWHWFGVPGDSEDRDFGRYSTLSRDWDKLCADAPSILPVRPAGNHRNDSAPDDDEIFHYYDGTTWVSKNFEIGIDPGGDGAVNGGFDTITSGACAKNVLTVGSVSDALTNAGRVPSASNMTTYSGFGPTDDGRIKPDLVANGTNVYSSSIDRFDTTATNFYQTRGGTSMAVASVAGAATLLQEVSESIYSQGLTAAALKGLLIHTADDLGPTGPDYRFGWGLADFAAAAEHLQAAAAAGSTTSTAFLENTITGGTGPPQQPVSFNAGRGSIVTATLCWTDPEPAILPAPSVDNPAPVLVNDLDLRITAPGGSVFEPYVLNPSQPALAAARGDNTRDNVEQVRFIASAAGIYTIEVSRKSGTNNLTTQDYALHLTVTPPFAAGVDNFRVSWLLGGAAPWFYEDPDPNSDGPDYVRSGEIRHGQSTTFEAVVKGPVVVQFRWKISSEADYDEMKFFVDGEQRRAISGETEWVLVSEALPEGVHLLRWTYSKDSDTSEGQDSAWVDRIRFKPAPFIIKDFRLTGPERANPRIVFQSYPGETYVLQKSLDGKSWSDVPSTMTPEGVLTIAVHTQPLSATKPPMAMWRVVRTSP